MSIELATWKISSVSKFYSVLHISKYRPLDVTTIQEAFSNEILT